MYYNVCKYNHIPMLNMYLLTTRWFVTQNKRLLNFPLISMPEGLVYLSIWTSAFNLVLLQCHSFLADNTLTVAQWEIKRIEKNDEHYVRVDCFPSIYSYNVYNLFWVMYTILRGCEAWWGEIKLVNRRMEQRIETSSRSRHGSRWISGLLSAKRKLFR